MSCPNVTAHLTRVPSAMMPAVVGSYRYVGEKLIAEADLAGTT